MKARMIFVEADGEGAARTARQLITQFADGEMPNLISLVAEAYAIIKWCDEHEGECLADHPGTMKQIRNWLANASQIATD